MVATHKTYTRWPSRKVFFLAITIWTVLVLASLLTQRDRIEQTAYSLAKTDAVANLTKDMAIRKWASNVGGVYIREEFVPPFNSLEEEQRLTVVPPFGSEPFKLVRVTPIHLLLAIQQTSNEEFGIQERLTSQQLRNIDNMPDAWEVEALDILKNDNKELVAEALPSGRGHGLMRVMIPMRMEEECLECHRDTLVPVGGLRGGAVIAVDLNAYRTAQEPIWRATQYWHFGIWVLGMIGIFTFQYFAKRRAMELLREEEMQRENEAAFSAMAEGAVIAGADGSILWANDAFSRISGFDPFEVIGKHLSTFVSGLNGEAFYQQIKQQIMEKGYWRGEIWNRKKNGDLFPEEMSIQALLDPQGKVRRFISVFSDITERKKTEKELGEYREHLEDLVKQRTEELTIARNQAETANRSKSVFLANMNHELRTPLNAVIGFSQLLEKDDSLSPRLQSNAKIISASGRHLLTLINDILELSKIESGKTQVVADDIVPAELLEEIVAMMRLRAEQAGIGLSLELVNVPPIVSLDAVMVRQVLLNLISNAIKFTPEGGVSVKVKGMADAGEGRVRLMFSVRDTGIGITAEDQERIFSPFEQAGPPNSQEGTGLGLSISREYVQMMGGTLLLDSKPGEGSRFYFDIIVPVRQSRPEKQLELEVTGLEPEERNRRILVIDDVAEARLLIRSLLEPMGFLVEEAGSISQAETIIATSRPDLLLLDWLLPDGRGIAFLQHLRQRDGAQPRVVVLTANALEENRREALEAGADDFLSKPFQKNELYRILEAQLDIHFIRESATQAFVPPPAHDNDLSAALAALPPQVREHIVQAAISLSPVQISTALQEIAAVDELLAQRLDQICSSRQFRALWQLLGIDED